MPTTQKTLLFLGGFFTSLGSFVVICSILGTTQWVSSKVFFSDPASNGTITLSYGLFSGQSNQKFDNGLQEPTKYFNVLELLSTSPAKTLHSLVIFFLVMALVTALLSAGFSLYNSISNPYQTFMGAVGVYTWSGLSMTLAFLTLVLFVVNTQSSQLSEALAWKLHQVSQGATLRSTTHAYGFSFWLLLLAMALALGTVGFIFLYQKARYQRKQEQRKPMEEAPRDGILF
ncbi:clarin-3 [Sorex fumeus]|uniref:clarin-3 n=1 Tax=Sorex fumeus TaxID=62283 RepID=UPI0024AD59F6|nr:clarin-3 [Sorex fumeus]